MFQVHSRSEKTDVSLESGLNVLSVSGLKGKALYTFKADDGKTHSLYGKQKSECVHWINEFVKRQFDRGETAQRSF